MSELTEKTLRTITERKIHPVPAWKRQSKNIAYWIGTIILVLCSAFATALVFHASFEIDWGAYLQAHFLWYEILFSGVPFFSLSFVVFFLVGSIMLLQKTRRGYRYPTGSLFMLFILSSGAMGYFIESSPLDEPLENFLLSNLPRTEELQSGLLPSAEGQWSQPEKGLLGGSVMSISDKDIQLLDSKKEVWTVDYSDSTFAPGVDLETTDDIKVIGKEEENNVFRAEEIRRWERSREDEEDDDEEGIENEEEEESSNDEEDDDEEKDGEDDDQSEE